MTPESRSRKLAAKATPGPRDDEPIVVEGYGKPILGLKDDPFSVDLSDADQQFIAFHDPSLITAYVDVVSFARDMLEHEHQPVEPCADWAKAGARTRSAIARLDALAKDRRGEAK